MLTPQPAGARGLQRQGTGKYFTAHRAELERKASMPVGVGSPQVC